MTRVESRSLVHSGGTVSGRRGFSHCGFVWAVIRGLVFRDVCSVICRRHGEIACVLKFEHFVAPAGPSRLKTSGKQLQALGFGSDVGLQHLYRKKDMRMRRGWSTRSHPNESRTDALSDPSTSLFGCMLNVDKAWIIPGPKTHQQIIYSLQMNRQGLNIADAVALRWKMQVVWIQRCIHFLWGHFACYSVIGRGQHWQLPISFTPQHTSEDWQWPWVYKKWYSRSSTPDRYVSLPLPRRYSVCSCACSKPPWHPPRPTLRELMSPEAWSPNLHNVVSCLPFSLPLHVRETESQRGKAKHAALPLIQPQPVTQLSKLNRE